jgi:hypothetical protein
VAILRWTSVAGDATRAELEEEGTLFEADERVVEGPSPPAPQRGAADAGSTASSAGHKKTPDPQSKSGRFPWSRRESNLSPPHRLGARYLMLCLPAARGRTARY